jgi:hypothetical protein
VECEVPATNALMVLEGQQNYAGDSSWIWDDLWRILEYTAHVHDQGEDNGKEQLELKTVLVHFDILLPLTGAV